MNTPINRKGFIQICIVVADIEKAAKKWADLFGISVPKIRETKAVPDEKQVYRGKGPTCYGLKVCNIEMPGFVIELHQPDENPSTFREFIDKHGNGVHHIGFEAGDKRDNIVCELSEAGYALRTVGYYPGSSWTIVDTEDELGVNLNIKPVR